MQTGEHCLSKISTCGLLLPLEWPILLWLAGIYTVSSQLLHACISEGTGKKVIITFLHVICLQILNFYL